MAQAEVRPAGTLVGGPSKVRIKLKLPSSVKSCPTGTSNAAAGPVDQLAELHAAVEAFCRQGVHSLPGCVLLSPWREPSPAEQLQQQVNGAEQLQPARKRVRKRRAPEAGLDASGAADLQQLSWGRAKRPRSHQHRAPRDALQLSNSIHSMLPQQPVGSLLPAQPSPPSQPRAAAVAGAAAAAGQGSRQGGAAAARAQQRSRLRTAAVGQPGTVLPAAVQPQRAQPPTQQQQQQQEPEAMDVDVPAAAAAAVVNSPAVEARVAPAMGGKGLIISQMQQQQQQQERQAAAQLPGAGASPQAGAAGAGDSQQDQASAAVAAEAAGKPQSPASETSAQQHIGAAAPQHAQQLLLQQPKPDSPLEAPAAAPLIRQPQADSPPAAAAPAAAEPDQQKQEQQPDAAAAYGLGPEQQQQQQKQPEQTAVSRDRSQCSLPRPAEHHLPAVVSMPAPPAALPSAEAAAAMAPASSGSGRLLELAPGAMTPAALALAGLTAVPEVKQRILPPEGRPVRSQEEALAFLATVMDKAKQLKHHADKRQSNMGGWDVFGLSFYALSSVEFLLYWDTAHKLLAKLKSADKPVERLQQQINQLAATQFLRQTGALCTTAMTICSNCKGPDVAKQALRMLLERLSAISNMRNLHSQHKSLEGHIRLLKTGGASYAGSSSASSNGGSQAQQQQQQQARLQQVQRAAAAAGNGKPPSPSGLGGSSWSPMAQQQQQQTLNKRSPDDSNTSNQERLQLPLGPDQAGLGLGLPGGAAAAAPGGGSGAAAGGGAAGAAAAGGGYGPVQERMLHQERALQLAKSERLLMDCMQELLRMTDGMHQTVMRMQQFLESPDVLANQHARTAALHISVLGLDAGMFSIPRVAAHTEAAVMRITKLLRAS